MTHIEPSPKDACLADLRARILSTDLPPGEPLDETALAAAYGISRTPMREVLQRLHGEGHVEMAPNRGAKVASMDISVLRTFFRTAPTIYAHIARLAAEMRTDAQLDALKAAQSAFAAAASGGRGAEAALANHAFHARTGEMAANPYLSASLSRLLIDHTRLSQTFYRPASEAEDALVRRASGQHDALIDAIETRDADRAVAVTLEHWALSRDRMERFVRPDPLPLEPAIPKDRPHAV